MHDEPQFPEPGDSSSGIHRIVDPVPDQPLPETIAPAVAHLDSPDDSTGLPHQNDPASGQGEAPGSIDPSAETVADGMLEMPLVTLTQDSSTATASRRSSEPHRPSLLLIALGSYASAATLALLYLYFAMSRAREHALENLPDVPPLDVKRGEVMKLAPADAQLPAGHRLALGEARRFGNLLVEPLKVELAPVEFVHFSGRTAIQKPATPPVLKLWLRFTNLSTDQTIAPLDPDLVFRRAMLDVGPRANQFVRRVADEGVDGPQFLLYDHPLSSEWDLREQRLGVRLAPGESLETFLPSGEDAVDLAGPLVWRVHFRKGYSPRGYGVTTLVDVEFAAPAAQPAEASAAG